MTNTQDLLSLAAATGTASSPRRFRFIQPSLPPLDRVLAFYQSSYGTGMLTNATLVGQFETAAAATLDVNHCVAVGSCTSGLMMTARALELQGEVILPSFTFFATGQALLWAGLTPVFAECSPDSWTIDPDEIEKHITEKTSAIVGVHMYGNPCSVEALERLAQRYKLKLIFDAAHAFGSSHEGKPVGGYGDAEVFSLTPTKPLVCGEGGLISTNDAVLAKRLAACRNYGDYGAYNPELLGMSARMSEFSAALGLAGIDLVPPKIARNNQIAARYTERLSHITGTTFQTVKDKDVSTYKDYSILIDPPSLTGVSRNEIARTLLLNGIETKRYFDPPLHLQTLFRKYHNAAVAPLPVTERLSRTVLSLPIYADLADESVDLVIDTILQAVSEQFENNSALSAYGPAKDRKPESILCPR